MAKMRGTETLFFVFFLDYWHSAELYHQVQQIKGSPQQKSLKNSELASSSDKQEEHLARLFDEILLQVYSNVPFEEARTAEKSMTKRPMEESSPQQKSLKNSELASSSDKQEEHLARLFGHISEEERNEEPSLFNRAAGEQLPVGAKETLTETAKPDTHNRTVSCLQLLHFLQKNNVLAISLVVGILVATVLLLFALTVYSWKKQALYRPANMTYNIFIMNGKTWLQKSPEKNSRKYTEKQQQLPCDARV